MFEITAQNYLRHVLLLPRGEFILKTQLSFLVVNPGAHHRPLSSCLVYVVYVKEFLRFFSWQHLENNVWNQKQICYFCAETSAFFKLASKQPFALAGSPPLLKSSNKLSSKH